MFVYTTIADVIGRSLKNRKIGLDYYICTSGIKVIVILEWNIFFLADFREQQQGVNEKLSAVKVGNNSSGKDPAVAEKDVKQKCMPE